MKTKISDIIILLFLISIIIYFFAIPSSIINAVHTSITIWLNNVVPSLFPIFIVTDLLINYGVIELFSELLKNIMQKIFHVSKEASFVLIGSLFSGFPSSSKYIKELIDNNLLNIEEASYLLQFNHYPNPMFVIAGIGESLFHNQKIGIILLLSNFISSMIIAYIFRPKKINYHHEKINISHAINNIYLKRKRNSSFISKLSDSILKTIDLLFLLLGIITSFFILSEILKNTLHLSNNLYAVITGILEMTQGVNNISLLNIPLNIKVPLISFLLSFGGFSIHMQSLSILDGTNIKYFNYLKARIIHGIFSFVLSFIIYSTWLV